MLLTLWGKAHSWVSQQLVPDPPPTAPPGKLTEATNTILGWMKWGGLVGAVGALIAAGIMMAVGRRNRNNMAIEGAVSIPWVVAGLAVILGSASVVGFLLQ
ncbi:hypothetical protein [Saccharomonospora azurea]|uniref:TrbC/VIRB2 family protein n=1 Tax=Saccharomonospora azurea NA-128 TaxID=882081 RepID=H8G9A1_9PSEU|nr:hypothetical protein [Saccharomonospora azurea]EHY87486.1 hypothetical protein SacazDRAFT_00528 [Saccharomonospora azurea NA-128]